MRKILRFAQDDKQAFSILKMLCQTSITTPIFYPTFRVQFDESMQAVSIYTRQIRSPFQMNVHEKEPHQ
jgi:hypothetical protein